MNEQRKQLKILVVGPDSPHLSTFLSRLLDLGHLVHIISSGTKYIRHEDIDVVNFSLRFKNFIKTTRSIRKIAKQFQPDVVWTHQANAYSFFAVKALKGRFPIALTVWGSDILLASSQSKVILSMTKYILKNSTIIASDSLHLASETKKLLGNQNTPIEICQFGIKTFDVDLTKEKVFYSNRGHHDIYRIPEIIQSFAKFDANNPESDWILVIAGESFHTPKLKDLVSTLKLDDKVKFVGFLSTEENAKWYGKASYFISIPKSDGTAVSLLEAMYYQCIPIVSDLPANREWIKHLENGYIATDLDHDFLSEVLDVDFKEAKQNNRKRIDSDGTAQASCNQIQSILNSITCN